MKTIKSLMLGFLIGILNIGSYFPALAQEEPIYNGGELGGVVVQGVNCKGGKIIEGKCVCPSGTSRIKGKGCLPCSEYGIKLNTDVPFVGNCIGIASDSETTPLNAFPKLMGAMMKLILTVIMVMSLLLIVAAGVMMTTGGAEKGNYTKGMEIIRKVAIGMALLGASGVILKLINPNFFV